MAISTPITASITSPQGASAVFGSAEIANEAAIPAEMAINTLSTTYRSLGMARSRISWVTATPATYFTTKAVTIYAVPEPRKSKPKNCLANPPKKIFRLRKSPPIHTAREGPRKGATHMEPITIAELLISNPPVAIAAEANTIRT